MNIRCAFGWHRWKVVMRELSPGRMRARYFNVFVTRFVLARAVVADYMTADEAARQIDWRFLQVGRICADCRKRDINR